jgi:hypothetical protein
MTPAHLFVPADRASPRSKYNENRVFAARSPGWTGTICLYFKSLPGKYVIRRINEFFRPMNELRLPYQPKNNEFVRAVKIGKCGVTCQRLHARQAHEQRRLTAVGV